MGKPEDVIKSVMTKLEKKGKGIVLMHDFQQAHRQRHAGSAQQLKANGYKVVHVKAKGPLQTLPQVG